MKQTRLTILVCSLFVAISAACSPSSVAPTPPGAPATQAVPATLTSASNTAASTAAPTVSLASSTPAPTTAPSTATPASQAIVYPREAGLDKLDSYAFTLRLSFKGKQDGQPLETNEVYTRTFLSNPAAVVTGIETTGESGSRTTMLVSNVGDMEYYQEGADSQCTAYRRKPGSASRDYVPTDSLLSVHAGKLIGPETVNGVPTRHYVIDKASFESIQADQVSGDIWIAESGAFVARYNLRVSGGEEEFGKGTTGEATMTFELRDVGAKKPIALPKGCAPPNSPT